LARTLGSSHRNSWRPFHAYGRIQLASRNKKLRNILIERQFVACWPLCGSQLGEHRELEADVLRRFIISSSIAQMVITRLS
jgi:hypothetical protein